MVFFYKSVQITKELSKEVTRWQYDHFRFLYCVIDRSCDVRKTCQSSVNHRVGTCQVTSRTSTECDVRVPVIDICHWIWRQIFDRRGHFCLICKFFFHGFKLKYMTKMWWKLAWCRKKFVLTRLDLPIFFSSWTKSSIFTEMWRQRSISCTFPQLSYIHIPFFYQ